MTSGLVNASFSLPEWQAVKMIFFAPCPQSGLVEISLVPGSRYGKDQITGRAQRKRQTMSGGLRSLPHDSHDGDDNENVKTAIGWMGKTTTLHVHHASLHISLPSLHYYDGKMPNLKFYGEREQATAKVSFSFWTWIWFLGIRLKKNSLEFDKVNE